MFGDAWQQELKVHSAADGGGGDEDSKDTNAEQDGPSRL
jgi:hypothetical protein